MQGRVAPEQLTKLQVFPSSCWEEEFDSIARLGFGYVEILFDKAGACQELLAQPAFRSWIRPGRRPRSVGIRSACLDALCGISARRDPDAFATTLKRIVTLFSETSVDVLVVPFFDENEIAGKEELIGVLRLLDDSGVDALASRAGVTLSLETCLSSADLLEAFDTTPLSSTAVCYDLGNAAGLGFDTASEILDLNRHIRHVHIKDKPLNGANVRLGSGSVDFKASFNALRHIAYDGLMILETVYGHSPEAEAAGNLDFVTSTLSELDAA